MGLPALENTSVLAPPLRAGGGHGQEPCDWIPDRAIETPKEDSLLVGPVAETTAKLIVSTIPPANIAVFGPWGSGKTSFGKLLHCDLRHQSKKVKFLEFNAWKFSETPLRRHFLSELARQIDPKHHKDWADKLYAESKSTTFELKKTTVLKLLALAILFIGVVAVVVSGVSGLLWFLNSGDLTAMVTMAVSSQLPAIILSGTFLGILGTLALSDMKIERNTTLPSSEEQFDNLFTQLIELIPKRYDRVVVFVDELDRAPAEAVHSTLETIRTFLEHPRCIFVVAADQVVLEAAIKATERVVVPGGREYYSSGSAYMDKIFQYQLSLPPVPSHTLTRFALDLVRDRCGVWEELGTRLPDVVSILIPSHVRSPRRVKVLLNAYVLAYRIAMGRDKTLVSRDEWVLTLARLVALRTEFPLFYREVEERPELLEMATAAIGGDQATVNRFAGDAQLAELVKAFRSGDRPTDVMLSADAE